MDPPCQEQLNQITASSAVLSQFKYIGSERTEANQGNKKYFCFTTVILVKISTYTTLT